MAAFNNDSDGSWADDPVEDPEQGDALDMELARRAILLGQRKQHGDWCHCGFCFPVENAFSAFDVTCCQESDPAKQICQENGIFQDENPYPCVHPSFCHLVLYERALNMYMTDGVNERCERPHERLRCLAYRAYIIWVHGFLERRNHTVVPHCVQKAIRQKFPDPQP